MGLLLAGAAFAALYWLERRRPLRGEVEPKPRRTFRNLAVAALSAVTVQAAEQPVAKPLAELVERRRWGLVQQLGLPGWLKTLLAVVLMDYTLYMWHILTHKVPVLWRCHRPHHVDLDLDASTALRFHFAEIALSVPWRSAQVAVIGVSPRALALWQKLTLAEIVFHHSNLDVSPELDRWLSRFVVTPRLHGIHHSIREVEQNSNWSSGLTVWDWLHGTLRRDVPQEHIVIGDPAYRDPADVTLPDVLAMPFEPQRPTWEPPARIADEAERREREVAAR
ncbi:MAG: sterol desaturase family protein [Zavarzinella sp.]|nr:sterol desaturase family protein [Zavarzinella sp.]